MFVFMLMTPVVLLADNDFLSLGIGQMEGHTTYQIGGKFSTPSGSGYLWNPISELEFPLEVSVAMVKGSFGISEYHRISAEIKKTITSDAGKMKDSDWGYFYADGCNSCDYNSLDVYSESDANLENGILSDIKLSYMLDESFFIGAGFKYQKFEYEVRDKHLNLYDRIDTDHAKDVLRFLAQVPVQEDLETSVRKRRKPSSLHVSLLLTR